jgi:hypothetical protein
VWHPACQLNLSRACARDYIIVWGRSNFIFSLENRLLFYTAKLSAFWWRHTIVESTRFVFGSVLADFQLMGILTIKIIELVIRWNREYTTSQEDSTKIFPPRLEITLSHDHCSAGMFNRVIEHLPTNP